MCCYSDRTANPETNSLAVDSQVIYFPTSLHVFIVCHLLLAYIGSVNSDSFNRFLNLTYTSVFYWLF